MAFPISRRNQVKTQNIFTITVISLILTACVAPAPRPDLKDPQSWIGSIIVKRDDFKKQTNYQAPLIGRRDNDGRDHQALLRAWKPDGGSVTYQIYVQDEYHGERRLYESAYNSNGEKLPLTRIDYNSDCARMVGGGSYCWHIEKVGIIVTREYLVDHQQSGITFRVYGPGGQETFNIIPAYITAFLAVAN